MLDRAKELLQSLLKADQAGRSRPMNEVLSDLRKNSMG